MEGVGSVRRVRSEFSSPFFWKESFAGTLLLLLAVTWQLGPSLRSRMVIAVGLHQVLLVKVSVDLGRGDIGMAEKLLDNPQVRSAL